MLNYNLFERDLVRVSLIAWTSIDSEILILYLSRAVKEEVISSDYICTLCHLIFSTAEELIRHKEHHDVGSGVHTCTLCRRVSPIF